MELTDDVWEIKYAGKRNTSAGCGFKDGYFDDECRHEYNVTGKCCEKDCPFVAGGK